MKNGLLFLFVIIVLASCSSNDNTLSEGEDAQKAKQEESITQNLEATEEPEFVIEAEYDPALAEKAELSKRNNVEKSAPIALTADDDDLTEDKNDLPEEVKTRSISAYDYKEQNFLSDPGNTAKGDIPKSSHTIKEKSGQELYFVVAGAYKDEEAAQKKINQVTNLGYKVELINFDENFKTVCVAKLESRTQADLLAKTLLSEKIDAYVVKRRK